MLLCSTATDGVLALWSINSSLDSWVRSTLTRLSVAEEVGCNREEVEGEEEEEKEEEEDKVCSEPRVILAVRVHQSGINDVAILPSKQSLCAKERVYLLPW